MTHDAWKFEKRGSVALIQPASKAALLNNWVDARALFRTWNSKVKIYVYILHRIMYKLYM